MLTLPWNIPSGEPRIAVVTWKRSLLCVFGDGVRGAAFALYLGWGMKEVHTYESCHAVVGALGVQTAAGIDDIGSALASQRCDRGPTRRHMECSYTAREAPRERKGEGLRSEECTGLGPGACD